MRRVQRALLGLDLAGQTSASYNMRTNYHKCLLEFETYVASGAYWGDRSRGTLPSTVAGGDPFGE